MQTNPSSRIAVDDFSIGTTMTVFRNRAKEAAAFQVPETDYLKGTVLRIQAISLPYLLVQAFDPLRGSCLLSVDVREHEFMPVSETYAVAIIRQCTDAAPSETDS